MGQYHYREDQHPHQFNGGGTAAGVSPEQRLWQYALLRAALDATAANTRNKKTHNSSVITKERAEARAWFERAGRGFREVCALAGFEHEAVAEAYRSGQMAENMGRLA